MFESEKPPENPGDPDQTDWFYQQGHELRDPSLKEISDYFARLVSWYTQGGFTAEMGVYPRSGHNYKIAYWEVLNKPDLEHNTGPKAYTERYDAIVNAIRQVDVQIKFIGLSLAFPGHAPEFFENFLNPQNHQPGVPRKLLLINKRNSAVHLALQDFTGGVAEVVDQVSAGGTARREPLNVGRFRLPALGVAVLTAA